MSNPFARNPRLAAVLSLACLLLAAPLPARAAEAVTAPCYSAPVAGKRVGDQIWHVCTRHLGCDASVVGLPDYRVRYYAQGAWHTANANAFLAQDDPALPTVFFIHGNRYSSADAVDSGWEAYYALMRRPPTGPIRLVIWSWPSEREGGPIRDARAKAARTLAESYYLARLMTNIKPEVATSLLGYSFGGRVALGAVHLAAGGQLAGRTVPVPPTKEVGLYRVAILAAGVENNGLMPGARFQMAMSRTEQLLNFYNSCDPILRRYHLVSKGEHPVAMGYTGIVGEDALGGAAQRIWEQDVSEIVGKSHNEDGYFQSEHVMRQVRATVLVPPVALSAKVAKKK